MNRKIYEKANIKYNITKYYKITKNDLVSQNKEKARLTQNTEKVSHHKDLFFCHHIGRVGLPYLSALDRLSLFNRDEHLKVQHVGCENVSDPGVSQVCDVFRRKTFILKILLFTTLM